MLLLNNELESCRSQKLTEHIKCTLHPKFERKRTLGRYFMTPWFFNKVLWFVLAAMLEVILLPSNMAAKTTFCLYPVKHLIVTLRCVVNVTTSSFQHVPWSLSAKFVFRKKQLIMLKITFWPATNLLIKKMVQVWKTKSLLFCLRYDPLIVFRKQNQVTFIFINTMSHDLLRQMAYYNVSI